MKKNIALIGMSGVGKSYISKILAQKLGYGSVSVDDLIDQRAKELGTNKDSLDDGTFKTLEELAFLSLENKTGVVIDTGVVLYIQIRRWTC